MKRWAGYLVLGVLLVGVGVPVDALAQAKPAKTKASATNAESEEQGASEGGRTSAFKQPGGLLDRGEPHERKQMLSFYGILPWGYGFGAGAAVRYGIPIVKEGFIRPLNDSIEIEFGGDFWYANYGLLSGFDYGYLGLLIPVEGQWSFHITPKFTAFAKLGLGWRFNFWTDSSVPSSLGYGGFWWNTAWGVNYKLGESLWVRGEVGITGLKAGVGLTF
ncbi:hypothetical protein [Archangium lipolyticum]|uniref:hypothetical protein n=1 Tax=Archangium lipolyticum TaxID=2970465 RepID=UPI002149DE2C|nr:hypothetical protein [Archangium lipolyticum]